MTHSENIEFFFLKNLLRISIAGTSVILASDLILYPADTLSLIIDVAILVACIASYLLKRKFFTASVLTVTFITLSAMFYQCLAEPFNTTTSLSIILIIGFIHSILIRGRLVWFLHGLTCASIISIFALQTNLPAIRNTIDTNDVITIAITYLVLYAILNAAALKLKTLYDQLTVELRSANENLHQKAYEIEAQNEELLQSQESLNELNKNLEMLVQERTAQVVAQNDVLMKYTYKNAHHLRGPVARLLGLISVQRMESKPDYPFFFNKIEDQAKEIDQVVKQINSELGNSPENLN